MTQPGPRIAPPDPAPGEFLYGTAIDAAIDEFSADAVKATSLDPITTEVVRLRCARYHDCQLCQALRYGPALSEGFDEELGRKIDNYEASDLDPALKAALRLTDAVILNPAGAIDPQLREEIRAHYSDEQIGEILHDIVKWSFQKVLVSLKLDAPVADGVTELSFDSAGNPVFGDPVQV